MTTTHRQTFRALRNLTIGYAIGSALMLYTLWLALPHANLNTPIFVDTFVEIFLISATTLLYLAWSKGDV